jgi:ribose 5-phosphate isomerase A
LNDVDSIAFTIDGADEADPQFQLIKGGGGALLREKMVAAASQELIIIVDESKMVETLGKFPLPVEVISFGWNQVRRRIKQLGCEEIILRQKDGKTFISDQGNYILDCHFQIIAEAAKLNEELNLIPGVVETGLFIDMATAIITGYEDGRIEVKRTGVS